MTPSERELTQHQAEVRRGWIIKLALEGAAYGGEVRSVGLVRRLHATRSLEKTYWLAARQCSG